MHYFGKDKKQAIEWYLEQAAFLHNGKAKMFKTTNGNMTLKSLCNIYLNHQQAKATSAEITIRHHADQISCLKKFMSFVGQYHKINEISNINAVSSVKIMHKQRHVFTSEEIHRLFDFADVQMKAMIWLGLNWGFGCTDCAQLKWSDLDLVNGRVKLARKKTGVPRDLQLSYRGDDTRDKIIFLEKFNPCQYTQGWLV